MTQPIAPALTAEEWARPHKYIQAADYDSEVTGAAEIYAGAGYLKLTSHAYNQFAQFDTPDMLWALIALANAALPNDDPRKIRHGPVRLVRDAADAIEGEWGVGQGTHPMANALRRFVDALDSYLPPLKNGPPPPTTTLIARANTAPPDGDLRKITYRHTDFLRDLGWRLDGLLGTGTGYYPDAVVLWRIADILASYLPPESTTDAQAS